MSIIENPVTSNCLGKFAISREMVRAMPEVILVVMSKMIVVEAKSSFIHNEIAYYAYSRLFDVCQPNQICPEYKIIISRPDAGPDDIQITAEKTPHSAAREYVFWSL